MDSAEQCSKDGSPTQKVSVSMSAYMSAAVERQIQRDLLEELLQAKEAEIGPPSPDVQEWAAEIFGEAESMAANKPAGDTSTRLFPWTR
ncbi:hypothetical protein [Streptomyces sp. NPDC101234]|uniref:hypothetical protein n=1 Tax=Streptomyces sp. NPDC101234 TaxID=3366138 RepID=UPI00381CB916